LPEIDFNNYTVDSSEESYAMRFFELSQDLFLKQIVQENTRFMTGQKPSRLDYVFLRDDSIVDELQYLPPIGSSDHTGLLWGLRSDQSHQVEIVSSKKAYSRGDCVKMANMLMPVDWNNELANIGVEDTWDFIKSKYVEAVDQCIPCVGCKKKKKSPKKH